MSPVSWFQPPARRHRLIRVALLVFFTWLAGRFWHPYYGFTRFLQMDEESAAHTLPELRAAPIFLYEDGYDGHYYAQLAARPAVNDPALSGAIDSVGYRARRIFLSWTAWAVGGGDPVAAVRAYAWLNLVIWAGLAALLWRIFPGPGWRDTAAWAGVLFSAGALHGVRLALTDPLALLFVAGAVVLVERNRRHPAAALLGLGALARETVVLGAVSLLPAGKATRADWLRTAGCLALIAAPLALWLLYLRSVLGPTEPGMGNFILPVVGWAEKWGEALRRLHHEPDHYLALTTLLAHLALTVQAAWLIIRRQPSDPWWRLGAVYVGLMLFLGTAVWEGHPGASTRVLLPLALAFNVLVVRRRAAWPWLVLGNLSVLAGVLALWSVPRATHELTAGWGAGSSYVVQTDVRWHPVERDGKHTWAWAATEGGLRFACRPAADGVRRVRLAVRGIAPRELVISQDGRELWRGGITEKLQWIEVRGLHFKAGRAELELRSDEPPSHEGGVASGRALGFAIYGARPD